MDTELLINFAAFAAIWGSISPLVINLIKNVGFAWSPIVKKGVAVGFAVVGAFVAYGLNVGWDVINLTDWTGFWLPLIGAFGAIYPIMLTTYNGFWGKALAAVGVKSDA